MGHVAETRALWTGLAQYSVKFLTYSLGGVKQSDVVV